MLSLGHDISNDSRPFQFTLRKLLYAVVVISVFAASITAKGIFGATIFGFVAGCIFAVTAYRRKRHVLFVPAGLLALPFLAIVLSSGTARGVEFSPDLFKHRSFKYWASPLLPDDQIGWRRTEEWTSPLEDYLHSNGYIKPVKTVDVRWDLIKGFRPGVRGWSGGAKYMCQGLGCWGEGSEKWVTWSAQHPDLAAVLWPKVIDFARSGDYYAISWLFRHGDLEKAKTSTEINKTTSMAQKMSKM